MTSHSRAICSKSQKIVEFVKIMAQTFLIFVSTCNLTDIQVSMYDRKIMARPFDTIHDIIRSHSLVQSLSKDRNDIVGNRRVKCGKLVSSHFYFISWHQNCQTINYYKK